MNCLEGQIPCFLEHVFIKRKQSTFFEDRIAQLKAEEAIVQVDFAETIPANTKMKYELLTGAKNKQHCSL